MSEQAENNAAMDTETLNQIESDFVQFEEQAEQVGPEIPTGDLIYPIIGFTLDLAAPNWEINETEKKALSDAYADLLDKYFPNVAGHFGIELSALLITTAIFAPRIGKPRILLPETDETTRPGDDSESQPAKQGKTAPALDGFADLPEVG
ncbi:MAG: hypothetical protein IBX55_18645 [Methyloprofundus sp.]|nr:hypothetical protein [Methyloprofundus sp.]